MIQPFSKSVLVHFPTAPQQFVHFVTAFLSVVFPLFSARSLFSSVFGALLIFRWFFYYFLKLVCTNTKTKIPNKNSAQVKFPQNNYPFQSPPPLLLLPEFPKKKRPPSQSSPFFLILLSQIPLPHSIPQLPYPLINSLTYHKIIK
jgi:hypothetical protein